MSEEPAEGNKSNNESSVTSFVERMKTRKASYDIFSQEFQSGYGGELVTTVPNSIGSTDKIAIHSHIQKPEILEVNLDEKDPVHFEKVKFDVKFNRYPAPVSPADKPKLEKNDPNRIWLDFGDEDDLFEKEPEISVDYSQEKILEDLKKKFGDLGLADIPLQVYARRLAKEHYKIDKEAFRLKADAIVPLYRDLEVKRLLAEPNAEDSHYYEIAKQRQHVYDQLTELLRESGMAPSQITEYLMHGLFESGKVAGIPIFTNKHGDRYLVIDYAFSGYDEQNPVGTDFSGKYTQRTPYEIDQILDKAEELGYSTCFDNEYVSGGTHQQWNWHGIKIDDFDKEHLENNIKKVLTILENVGIDPLEAANPNEEHIHDRFIIQRE